MVVLRHTEALVKSLEEHVNDAHHRVTQAALEALASYVEQFGAQLETFLDRLLPKVFLKISDPKEATRNGAVSVLESARVSYQAAALIPVLLKVLAQPNPKIRLGCIDFLQYLMEHCAAEVRPYFNSGFHTKQCLLRVAPLVADKNPGLRKLSAKTLSYLYKLNTRDFLSNIVALPTTEQANARKAVAVHVPEIDRELIAYTRQSADCSSNRQPIESNGRNRDERGDLSQAHARESMASTIEVREPDDVACIDAMAGMERRRAAAEDPARATATDPRRDQIGRIQAVPEHVERAVADTVVDTAAPAGQRPNVSTNLQYLTEIGAGPPLTCPPATCSCPSPRISTHCH